MRDDILERKNEILQWIIEEQPKAYMCQQLNCKYDTLNSYLKKMGIQYEGQAHKKGQWKGGQGYISATEYLGTGKNIHSALLRQKLIREKIKENKCEICGLSTWLDYQIPLELHHLDSNHWNNELNNLQILCANCHALMENRGYQQYKALKEEQKKINYCIDCGKPILNTSTRCEDCYHKSTRIEQYNEETHIMRNTNLEVNREELKKMIRTTSFVKVGQKYGVTDNAVRKWCDKFGLPRKSSEIKKISDEEWKKI